MLDNLLEKKGKVKLDVKDIRILYELICDGRQSISKIAKKVKLSKQGVKYKMERLTKSGVIEGYFSVVDVYKLGFMFNRVFFRFQTLTPEKLKEINDFVAKNNKVSLITNYFGAWDSAFIVCSKNIFEFNAFLREFYDAFEPYIRDEMYSMITDIYMFSHSYSEDKYLGAEMVHIGGSLGNADADEFDNKILNLLANNGRIPIYEMARKLNVSDKKIVYRMKKLIEQKIILGFKAVLNNDVLELEQYKVFLSLKKINEQREKDLINFCKHNKKIISLTKVLGTRAMEIDMIVSNKRETWDIIKQLEFEFKDIISNTLTTVVVSEKHVRCLPL
jgi:DNA-binding Lrp family transcriptional regulator